MTEFELTFEIHREAREVRHHRVSAYAEDWTDLGDRVDEWLQQAEEECDGLAVLIRAEIVGAERAAGEA